MILHVSATTQTLFYKHRPIGNFIETSRVLNARTSPDHQSPLMLVGRLVESKVDSLTVSSSFDLLIILSSFCKLRSRPKPWTMFGTKE